MSLIILAVVAVLVTGGLIFHLESQARRHTKIVADLCQRLQAPDTAVAQHVVAHQEQPVSHLPFDDDGAWTTYLEELTHGG